MVWQVSVEGDGVALCQLDRVAVANERQLAIEHQRGLAAAGLDLTLSQLLRLDEDRHVVIVRAGERRTRRKRGHKVEELTPPLPGQRADVSVHTLGPGAATGAHDDPPVHEPGSRETTVVLEGAAELFIDGQRHELQEGDSVTFDADLPHHFENPDGSEARFFAVVAAGLRRS